MKRKPQQRHDRPSRKPARFPREVVTLFEDDAVIVLDKPPGLLSVPIKGSETPSAWSLLAADLKQRRQRAFVVHRIDRFASGILLFAKTPRDRDALVKQFLAHKPKREYLAVVRGRVEKKSGTLIHYFHRQGMHQQLRSEHDKHATKAELRYSVEKTFADATLVRVELVTGLQNQIRAQFAAIDHPLIGDRKYRPEEAEEARIQRVALHAAQVQFQHPRTGETVSVHSKPPADLSQLLRVLERARP